MPTSKLRHSRSSFTPSWLAIPRDYLARRRYFRTLSSILMIFFLSVLVAGVIIYSSSPGGFHPAGR